MLATSILERYLANSARPSMLRAARNATEFFAISDFPDCGSAQNLPSLLLCGQRRWTLFPARNSGEQRERDTGISPQLAYSWGRGKADVAAEGAKLRAI
jgi:hypothetical protein